MKTRTFVIFVTYDSDNHGDFSERDVEMAFKLAYPYSFGNQGDGPKRRLTVWDRSFAEQTP